VVFSDYDPELILYDDNIGNRISYPDYIEQDGRIFITETQKSIARVHELDRRVLEAMWNQHTNQCVATDGLVLDLNESSCAANATVAMPELPRLHDRSACYIDADTGATLGTTAPKAVEARGGFALELWVQFDNLDPWQVLFDSRGPDGCGLLVQLTDRQTVRLQISSHAYGTPGSYNGNGMVQSSCECDSGVLTAGKLHQIMFNIDAGPKLITVMVDGTLGDGGELRRFGWSRFHSSLLSPSGAEHACLAASLQGRLAHLRLYNRYLLSSEGVGNWQARIG